MDKSLFEFTSYKEYLNCTLDDAPKGARLSLAKAAGCQAGYVTHVLSGNAHFSLEQAEKIAHHLGHSDEQRHFFILLVNFGRAGTESLRRYYRRQLDDLRENRRILKNRVKFQKTLSVEKQAEFYSSWHYGAFHVGVSIPGCDTEKGLSDYFGVPIHRVNKVVSFLETVGLVVREGSSLKVGPSQVFLGSDSPLISKHHMNWRIEAIKSLDHYTERDLHYSGVFTASHNDIEIIREVMVAAIERIRDLIKPSKDEACFSYGFDLFSIGVSRDLGHLVGQEDPT